MNKISFKLAVFEYTSWGSLSALAGIKVVRKDTDNVDDLVRVSEWQDVEFDAIPMGDVMTEILESLQNEEDIENEKHNIAILNIQRKRQEMLAITLQPHKQSQERKIKTFMDGDMWCAVYEEGFTNIQECNAGYAETEQNAISVLKMQDAYDK